MPHQGLGDLRKLESVSKGFLPLLTSF